MEKEELKKWLKENLEVKVNVGVNTEIEVKILLEGEEIASDRRSKYIYEHFIPCKKRRKHFRKRWIS